MYSKGQLCSEYQYYHTGVDSGDCSFVCLLVLVCVLSAEYSENTESFQLSFVAVFTRETTDLQVDTVRMKSGCQVSIDHHSAGEVFAVPVSL